MTVEADIVTAITSLVSGRVFPDFAEHSTARPFITYQQIGGDAPVYVESTVPNKRNGRFQFNVWADTRAAAAALALQVEVALVTTLKATPFGAPVADFDSGARLYGTRQDFSIWFTPA